MPYVAVILGPKYAVRLEELTGADVFVVECHECRRVWRVPPHKLHLRWPAHVRLLNVGAYLRCRPCGVSGREHLDWRIERASPEDPPWM